MTGTMSEEYYLGTDVNGQMRDWWEQEFLPQFHLRFGQVAGISVLVFHQRVRRDMFNPNLHIAVRLTTDVHRATIHQGWNANIFGKWMVLAHTGAGRSDYIERHPELLESGMFPHDGAGWINGIPAGASGLPSGKDDFDVASRVVQHYLKLRAAAAVAALAASADRTPPRRMKYLDDPRFRAPVED